MSYQLISRILASPWFIHRAWADAHLPLVVALLNGHNVSFVERTGNESVELPFVIDPTTMERKWFITGDGQRNANIAPNSVGIIPITGPLTQYNGDCGEPGMIQRTSWLLQMNKSDNISSIVQLIDTPGGEGRAAHGYCSVMAKSSKPILSYVDNMCASLGMWFSSQSDEVYMSHDLACMGSIGSYVMLADWSGYLEKVGIKLHEIYAPQSTEKNKDYKDALKGDYSAVQEDLKLHVDAFINHVANSGGKTNRSDRARSNTNEWNSGKMFNGKDAVKMGLADGIKSLDQVVMKASWLSKRKK